MKFLLFVSLILCALTMSFANHWNGWGKFGYKVKVHHPSIHGWSVGPSYGWTSYYDTHDKSPKGWWHEPKHSHWW